MFGLAAKQSAAPVKHSATVNIRFLAFMSFSFLGDSHKLYTPKGSPVQGRFFAGCSTACPERSRRVRIFGLGIPILVSAMVRKPAYQLRFQIWTCHFQR